MNRICVGCGDSLLEVRFRRSLNKPNAKDVADLWINLMEDELKDPSVAAQIVEGHDAERPPQMCRKCFTAYRACAKQYLALTTSLRKASVILELDTSIESPPTPKRRRLRMSSLRSQGRRTNSSPGVDVSCNHYT